MFAVQNHSTLVTDADAATMCAAVTTQIRRDAARWWGGLPAPTLTLAATVQPTDWAIGLFDDPDQPGALGWHTEQGLSVFGKVFARPCYDHGNTALTGTVSVASVLSHEALELWIDPAVNIWCDDGTGRMVARECGDPVEADSYAIDGVMVSNFVLPAWFDPQATAGPYDHLGKLTAPFSMSAGSYMVVRTGGAETQVLADRVPDWKTPLKLDEAARTFRRLKGATR